MAGVERRALTGGEAGNAGAVGDAADVQVAVGGFIVDVNLAGDVTAGDVGYGYGGVLRINRNYVLAQRRLRVERRKARERCGQAVGALRQRLTRQLQQLRRRAARQRAQVKLIAPLAAGQRDVRILHRGRGVILHRYRADIGKDVIGAVLDEAAGETADICDFKAAAEVYGNGVCRGGSRHARHRRFSRRFAVAARKAQNDNYNRSNKRDCKEKIQNHIVFLGFFILFHGKSPNRRNAPPFRAGHFCVCLYQDVKRLFAVEGT